MVIDGPFAETKELIGGYWIIQVNSKEEAIRWAQRVPNPHGEGGESEIEIRQFLGWKISFPACYFTTRRNLAKSPQKSRRRPCEAVDFAISRSTYF